MAFDPLKLVPDDEEEQRSLRERLLEGVQIATPEESAEFFMDPGNAEHWGETQMGEDSPTGQDRILINDRKFEEAGSTDYREKALLGESLHRLKTVDPERYERLSTAAKDSPEYMQWAHESYSRAQDEGEKRPFDQWHETSRLDQVIGGYLLAGDDDIPTMRGWDRNDLPWGEGFRTELDALELELGMGPQQPPPEGAAGQPARTFDPGLLEPMAFTQETEAAGGLVEDLQNGLGGISQALLNTSKSIWNTAGGAARYGQAASDAWQGTGLPAWTDPFAFPTMVFKAIDEGVDIGTYHAAGMGDVGDAIGHSMEILPEISPTMARLGVKSEEAAEATAALFEGRTDLMMEVAKDPGAWAAFVGNGLPTLLLAWKSGGSLSFMGWLEAMDQANSIEEYEAFTGQKISHEQFVMSTAAVGAANAFLEKMGLDSILGKWTPKASVGAVAHTTAGFVAGMVGEGGTELVQEITQNTAGLMYDTELQDQAQAAIDEGEWKPFLNRMTEGAIPALMGGTGLGGPGGGLNAYATRSNRLQEEENERRRELGLPVGRFPDRARESISDAEAKERGLEYVDVDRRVLDKVANGEELTDNEAYSVTNKGFGRFIGDPGNEKVVLLKRGIDERNSLDPVEAPDIMVQETKEAEEITMEGEQAVSSFDVEQLEPDVSTTETFVPERGKSKKSREPRRSIVQRMKRAIGRTDTEPTDAQIKAGNYRKGHMRIQAVPISVENPKGSVREGTDRNGKKWQRRLADTYGYIKGTIGKDKDHLDTFVGNYPESDTVVIINQKKDPDQELSEGNFDEHKIMIGYKDTDSAIQAYNRNYDDRGALKGSAVRMSMAEFKTWLAEANTTKIAESTRETLYRGETAISAGGPSYSGSRAVAKQFAGDEDIIERTVKKSDIYEATDVAASNREAVDAVIEKARAQGKKAVRLSEGVAAAPSVLVFDATALRDDKVFEDRQRVPRRTNAGKGMSVERLQNALRPFYSMFRSAPPVRVVESVEDLPKYLQNQLKQENAHRETTGVYTQDGLNDVVYLIANNTDNAAQGIETMVHEIIGHYGLHQIVPPHQFDAVMDEVYKAFPKEVREIARIQNLDFTDLAERRIASEEYIAYTSQQILNKRSVPQKARDFVRRLVQMIANQFRGLMGKDKLFTDGQIMSMIAQASEYVQGPGGYVRDKQRGFRRHMSNPTYFSQMFKWLNEEKAKSMTAANWQQLIRGAMKKNTIKEEEVMWSGLMEWLEDLTWNDVMDLMATSMELGVIPQDVYEAWDTMKKANVEFGQAQQIHQGPSLESQQAFKDARAEQKAAINAWNAIAENKAAKIPREAILRFVQMNGVEIEVVPYTSTAQDLSHLDESYPDSEEADETDDDMHDDYQEFKENTGFDDEQTAALKEVYEEHGYDPDLTADDIFALPQMLLTPKDEVEAMDVEELNTLKDEWDGTSVERMEEEAYDQATEAFDSNHWEEFKDEWEKQHTRRTWSAGDWQIEAYGEAFSTYHMESGHEGYADSFDEAVQSIQEDYDENAEYDPDGESVGKWLDYTLPGGTGYREMLFRWKNPDEALYTNSTHWGGATNFVAHVRFDIREDENGNQVLFVDEMQSDWHQAGRKQGLKSQEVADAALEERVKLWNEYMSEDSAVFLSEMVDWDLTAEQVGNLPLDEQVRDDVGTILHAFRQENTNRSRRLKELREERTDALYNEIRIEHGFDKRLSTDENEIKRKLLMDRGMISEGEALTVGGSVTQTRDEILEILHDKAKGVHQREYHRVNRSDMEAIGGAKWNEFVWDGTSTTDMGVEAQERAAKEITDVNVPTDVVDKTWDQWLNENVQNVEINNDRSGGGTNSSSKMTNAMIYKGIAEAVYQMKDGLGQRLYGPGRPKGNVPQAFDRNINRAGTLLMDFGEAYTTYHNSLHGVAPAPFEANWQLLVIKSLVKEAVSMGHDKIMFAPGEIHGMPTRWGGAMSVDGVDWASAVFKQTVPGKKAQIGRWRYTQRKVQPVKEGEEKSREVEVQGVTVRKFTTRGDGSRDFGEWENLPMSKLHGVVGGDVAAIIKRSIETDGQPNSGIIEAEEVGRQKIQYAAGGSKQHLTGSRQVYNVITPNMVNSKFLKKYKTKLEPGGRVYGEGMEDVGQMELTYGVTGGREEPTIDPRYENWSTRELTKEEIEHHISITGPEYRADDRWWAAVSGDDVVQTASVSKNEMYPAQWLNEARAREGRQYFNAYQIVITPELAEAAGGGFPLFSKKEAADERFMIIDRHTGEQVGAIYQGRHAKKRARTRVDKLDNEYGGYRYGIKDVAGNTRFSKKRNQGPNLHQKYTGVPSVDEALEWAGLNIGPPKMRSLQRLNDEFNRFVSIDNKLRKAEQMLVDQFAGIKWAIHEVHGEHLSAEESGYKQAHFTTSGDSQMYAFLMHGLPEWRGGITQIKDGTKGLLEVFEPVANNMDKWGYWMAARRAKRLMDEGREHLFTPEKIEELMKLGDLFPEFHDVAAEYAAWNKGFLDWASEAGVINEDTRPLWENADYVPFYRIKADELGNSFDKRAGMGAAGIANQLNPIKRLRGGKDRLGDITENILVNLTHLASTAMKNQAMRTTVRNLEGSGLITPVEGKEWMKKEIISLGDLKKKLKAAGVNVAAMDDAALKAMQEMWTVQPPQGADIFSVLENGKKKYYHANETTLFRSITAMNQDKFSSLGLRWFMYPFRQSKRFLTSMITLAPGFMVANWFRDVAMAFVNSRHALWSKPRFDRSVTGAVKALQQSPEMVSMMAAGGAFYSGYINAMDPSATTKSLKRAMRKTGVRHRILDAPWKYWALYNDIAAASENANRIGQAYIPAIKAGESTAEAVWESKDLMNFGKHGDAMIMQWLVQSTPFLNARIQGLVRWGQRLVEAPGATFTKSFMYTLAVLAMYLRNRDEDWYKELTDEDKDLYIHFKIGEHHWRMPKAFEVGSIFGTVPERLTEWMFADDATLQDPKLNQEKDRTSHALDRMKFVLTEIFMLNISPLHMPQLTKPMIEASSNWNSFFRGPIVPEYMQDIAAAKPEMVYRATTSPSMRSLAAIMPRFAPDMFRNPMTLEHIMRGYTGTIGSYVMLMSDSLVRSQFDYPPRPALRWDQTPFASRFYRGQDPLRRTGYEQVMYDVRAAARGIGRAITAYEDQGRAEEIEAFRNEPSEYNRRFTNFQVEQAGKAIEPAYNQIRNLRNRMNQIWIDENMSPEAKLREINEHQQTMNELAKEAYERRPGSSDTDYAPIASAETVLTVPTMALLEDLDGQDQAGTVNFLSENGLIDTAALVQSLPGRPRQQFRDLLGLQK